jgi:hypothetical protein
MTSDLWENDPFEQSLLFAETVWGRQPIDLAAREYIRTVAYKYAELVLKEKTIVTPGKPVDP